MPATLTAASCAAAVARLARRDPRLAAMVARWGAPPFWVHPPGFAGLALAILAQQVSLESAYAAYARLQASIPAVSAESFLGLDDQRLRQIGFSRQKAGYLRQIAGDIVAGRLHLDVLEAMENDAARAWLQRLRGVGRWTADTYLLFSLRRADAWPSGDLALEKVMAYPDGQHAPLATAAADAMAERWRPWRSVAARILWNQYLHVRGRFDAVAAAWDTVGDDQTP